MLSDVLLTWCSQIAKYCVLFGHKPHGLHCTQFCMLVWHQGLTEPLKFGGCPLQGPRPPRGLPPLYAFNYYRSTTDMQNARRRPLLSLGLQGATPQPLGALRGLSNTAWHAWGAERYHLLRWFHIDDTTKMIADFLQRVMGPCFFSCGTRIRNVLQTACCRN